MSQTETVTLSDLEPVVMDLRATTTILDAMISENHENHDVSEKEDFAWAKVAGDLSNLTQRVVDMWSAAFHQRHEEITQLKAKHAEEIAALKAEKAAPGSKEEAGRLDAQWRMLAAVAKVATEYCTEAVYELEPFTPKALRAEPRAGTATRADEVVTMADLTLLFGAIDKLDCAITAYGCVMMELDDDPKRDDGSEVAAIKWLYSVLRDEAHNVRGYVELLDKGLNNREAA